MDLEPALHVMLEDVRMLAHLHDAWSKGAMVEKYKYEYAGSARTYKKIAERIERVLRDGV